MIYPVAQDDFLFFLREKRYEVIGADISPAMINQCEEKLNSAGVKQRVEFKVLDAENLSFPTASFDAVVSLRLFGHLPQKIRQKVLREFKRISKSFLVIAYYHKNSLKGFLRKKCALIKKLHGIL